MRRKIGRSHNTFGREPLSSAQTWAAPWSRHNIIGCFNILENSTATKHTFWEVKVHLGRCQVSSLTCSVFSPFEEVDPPVSLQHSESKRSKSQKCWVARNVLRSTNSRVASHSSVVFLFKTTKLSYLCSEGMTNSFSGTLSAHTLRQTGKNHFASKCTLDALLVAHLAGVRVDAVRLQHLSLLEEIELRRFWSLTSEKEKQSWSWFFSPFKTQIITTGSSEILTIHWPCGENAERLTLNPHWRQEIRFRWVQFLLDLVMCDSGEASFCMELCWYQKVKHWSRLQLVCSNTMLTMCTFVERLWVLRIHTICKLGYIFQEYDMNRKTLHILWTIQLSQRALSCSLWITDGLRLWYSRCNLHIYFVFRFFYVKPSMLRAAARTCTCAVVVPLLDCFCAIWKMSESNFALLRFKHVRF